jgi:hypothetical protein
MIHSIRARLMSMHRFATTSLVSVLLGAAAVTALPPSSASAATGSCDPSEFCMWWGSDYTGGLYEWAGSDSNLGDDHFENANTSAIVSNNTESVWNRGVSNPHGLVHVVVYDGTGYTGAGLCIAQGRKANLPFTWKNRISSYRWVTASTCSRYARL